MFLSFISAFVTMFDYLMDYFYFSLCTKVLCSSKSSVLTICSSTSFCFCHFYCLGLWALDCFLFVLFSSFCCPRTDINSRCLGLSLQDNVSWLILKQGVESSPPKFFSTAWSDLYVPTVPRSESNDLKDNLKVTKPLHTQLLSVCYQIPVSMMKTIYLLVKIKAAIYPAKYSKPLKHLI